MFGSSLGQLGGWWGAGDLELGRLEAVGAGRTDGVGGGWSPYRLGDEGRTRHATGNNLTCGTDFRPKCQEPTAV
jgi:hypothetical protein